MATRRRCTGWTRRRQRRRRGGRQTPRVSFGATSAAAPRPWPSGGGSRRGRRRCWTRRRRTLRRTRRRRAPRPSCHTLASSSSFGCAPAASCRSHLCARAHHLRSTARSTADEEPLARRTQPTVPPKCQWRKRAGASGASVPEPAAQAADGFTSVQDPVARAISAYRMWRFMNCMRNVEDPDPNNCPDPPLDAWMKGLVEERRSDPDSLCFFGGASVRACRARARRDGPGSLLRVCPP